MLRLPQRLHCQAAVVKNPLPESMRQKRSFLSLRGVLLNSLENLVPQILGRTRFDFGTFLTKHRRADIRARRSISQEGLSADNRAISPERPLSILLSLRRSTDIEAGPQPCPNLYFDTGDLDKPNAQCRQGEGAAFPLGQPH